MSCAKADAAALDAIRERLTVLQKGEGGAADISALSTPDTLRQVRRLPRCPKGQSDE